VPDTSETSLVQVLPVVVSTVSGHAPTPPRHYMYTDKYRTENIPYNYILCANINYYSFKPDIIPVHSCLGSNLEPVPFHYRPPRLW
jgi:hypothetical protein